MSTKHSTDWPQNNVHRPKTWQQNGVYQWKMQLQTQKHYASNYQPLQPSRYRITHLERYAEFFTTPH